MRCPYCGGLNQDRVAFCVNCGRDMRRAAQNAQSQRPPVPPVQQTSYPTNQPYHASNTAAQPQRPTSAPVRPSASPVRPVPADQHYAAGSGEPFLLPPLLSTVAEPEAPAPFPPSTMAQFEALLATGCQTYNVIESNIENGRKIVSIAYQRCAGWQQAATLLQVVKEQQERAYKTTVIRGVFPQQQNTYTFTNGQLQFDRDVRLGDQISKRYVVETGNGYAADTIRFVINE